MMLCVIRWFMPKRTPCLSVDEVMEVVTRALYDNDNTNWQSPPRSYNEERDKLLRERLTKAITRS